MSVSWQPENVERVAAAVKRVESWPLDAPQTSSGVGSGSFIPVVRVKVTSSTPTSGLYPCNYQSWDPDTKAWSDLGTNQWAQGFNGESLVSGTYYFGQISGVQQSDVKDIVQVVVGGGSGGATIDVIRLTTGTANGSGLYTAKIQTVTIGSLPTPFSDGADCYWYDANDDGTLNTSPTAYLLGKNIGTSGGLPVYTNADFNLGVKDIFANSQKWQIDQLQFDSPSSTISNDWTITNTGRVDKIAHNGLTITVRYCDTDGTIHSLKFENGLLKQRT